MSIERRREIRPQGLSSSDQNSHGLSTTFYRKRLEEQLAAEQKQQQREHHDRHQDSNKENEGIGTRGSRNKNQQIDYNATQQKQAISLEQYYSPAAQESLKQLGRFAQQVAFDQQRQAAWAKGQIDQAQRAEMKIAPNPSEISETVLQERVTNPAKRNALEEVTPSDENIRAAKRSKRDEGGNIANPNTEAEKKALADNEQLLHDLATAQREMDTLNTDKENIKGEVKAEIKKDRQEREKRAQQEQAELFWRQAATPSASDIDPTQQLDKKKHPDSNSDSNSDSKTQREQLEAQLRNARLNELSDTEIRNLQDRLNELPQATTKRRENDVSKSHTKSY